MDPNLKRQVNESLRKLKEESDRAWITDLCIAVCLVVTVAVIRILLGKP